MIVCFYPGAGGNRYLRYRCYLEFSTPGAIYDGTWPEIINDDRYYTDTTANLVNRDNILCHCVNTAHVVSLFPSHHEVIIIKSDYKKSLRRACTWVTRGLVGAEKMDQAFSVISWHANYYQQFPWDDSYATQIVDLEGGGNFASIMSHELNECQDSIFDFAWDTYYTYGSNAPIIDLYHEHFKQ